ncbi:hypothetical protein ColLi_09135 [Colletotrichum liriopes]|uniref:Uncharacterized protein n=1 Tax=Colletotrichum liriopes TaxID=708192 RepID=A0AA37GTM8_9PEZI|nr:hypothetical protein ColLi_09135 [Colletotrichum liriopes]
MRMISDKSFCGVGRFAIFVSRDFKMLLHWNLAWTTITFPVHSANKDVQLAFLEYLDRITGQLSMSTTPADKEVCECLNIIANLAKYMSLIRSWSLVLFPSPLLLDIMMLAAVVDMIWLEA